MTRNYVKHIGKIHVKGDKNLKRNRDGMPDITQQ